MEQAAFVFIRETLGPCGRQGLTSHPSLIQPIGAATGVLSLAWFSLVVSPARVLAAGPQQGASCAPSSLVPWTHAKALGDLCDSHIVFGSLFAKCVSRYISSPLRVNIYQGLSGCQTHARQECKTASVSGASGLMWAGGRWHGTE